jgi:hypothetical protein
MESILTSIKKLLGIAEDYEHFDMDITMHINSAFSILGQLGVGPVEGFAISGKDSKWSDFAAVANISNIENAKMYVYLKTRLIFDPPTSGIVTDSIASTLRELECRLNTQYETNM